MIHYPMLYAYVVRCNFTDPAREAAWNAWYGGPKIAQMLAKPHFHTCQRFQRSAGAGRDYLAIWTVQSPDAFETPEYQADWGFSEWTPLVTNWSRDLFDARTAPPDALAVSTAGTLHVVSFDGMNVDEALAARAVMTPRPEMLWLPVIGLDRRTPLIGLAPLAEPAAMRDLDDAPSPVQQALYRPISECRKA